jgi:hypothetical protein
MCASYHDDNSDKYQLDSFRYRGRVCIFNNKHFVCNRGNVRNGSEKDVSSLNNLFMNLNFDVDCFTDKTAKQMRQHINEISKYDYSNVGSLLVFIMSHGKQSQILGTDDEPVYYNEFIDPFKATKSLKDKPKMFFFNACRGQQYMPTHKDHDRERGLNDEEEKALATTPVEADFLFAYATVANYFAIRESENGSWFIQILCETIQKHKFTKDLLGILTRVNSNVSEKSGWDEQNEQVVKMMSTFKSQLKKDFYFTQQIDVILAFQIVYIF